MDSSEILTKLAILVKKYPIPLALGLLGLIFFSYGLIGLFSQKETASDIVFTSEPQATDSAKPVTKTIVVDIEGAVLKPGVYKLTDVSRVQDALIAAGGLSSAADRGVIEKNLNLAAKLADGAKLYIPKIGETTVQNSQTGTLGDATTPGLISINSATEKDLDALPGVGLVTAQKIIDGRPYETVLDLLTKKIVSSKIYDKLKDKISL